MEKRIADIMQPILATQTLGIDGDLFDSGLYSLMSVKIVYRLRQDLGVPVGVVDMFHYSTLSGSFRTGIGYSHHKINTKKN